MTARFISREDAKAFFVDKTVAVVGSGPGVLDNPPGKIDEFQRVVRVNNYRLSAPTGVRTDVFYSFFGGSIKKTAEELKRDGVTLCLCKCPDAQPIDSEWHRVNGKLNGIDFRTIYQRRAGFWFCDTYIPTIAEFMVGFELLGRHVPSTGFAAILDILSFAPRAVYLTGFDFFRSGIHNVTDKWRPGRPDDPIGHVPDAELAWLKANLQRHPIATDPVLTRALAA